MQLCTTAESLFDIRFLVDACHSNHLRHTCFMLFSFKNISVKDSKQACQGLFVHSTNIPASGCNILLVIRPRMWHKWCKSQIPAEEQIRCHQLPLWTVSCKFQWKRERKLQKELPRGSNEDLQVKDASEEAFVCSVLRGCLLQPNLRWIRWQHFPTKRPYPSNKLGVTTLNSIILVFSAISTSSNDLNILTFLILRFMTQHVISWARCEYFVLVPHNDNKDNCLVYNGCLG